MAGRRDHEELVVFTNQYSHGEARLTQLTQGNKRLPGRTFAPPGAWF
jgi:hypothetical protein